MHVLAMEVPGDVEPAGVVETDRVDNQSISIPVAQRLSFPCAIQIVERRMVPAIRRNHAVGITPTLGRATDVKEDYLRGRLNDLGRRAHARDARRHAAERRVLGVSVLIQLLNLFPELRLIQRLIRIGSADERVVTLRVEVRAISGGKICGERIVALDELGSRSANPDSAQIGMPVASSRSVRVWLGSGGDA